MLRALPAMVRTAASRSAAVRSGCFIFATSSSCLREILPTLAVLGVPLPFSMPIALRISTAAGGVLHDEGEAAVRVHGDDHRDRQSLLQLLGLRIELLAELHDVHTLLTQRRSDRGRWVRGARGHLQLDIALDFLAT